MFPGRIAEAVALSIATYWACLSLISEDMATVPWRGYELLENGGRELDHQSRVDWLLNRQPNDEMTPFSFRQVQMMRTLSYGNGYAEIERDLAGRPVWLWPIENQRVQIQRIEGAIWYRVTNWSSGDVLIPQQNMLHFKGMGDGIAGYSVLEAASRTLISSLGLDKYAQETSDTKNQMKLGGVLSTKKKLNPEARTRLQEDFKKDHLGKPGSVAVLEDEMTFEMHKFVSPQDLQLIQARQYSASEIARIFKVPPHKIGLLERSTNANIESQAIEYVVTCLVPWATRIEQEADVKLYGPRSMARMFTKHSFKALMRGDSKALAEFIRQMINNGVYSIDDARRELDENPVPNGDARFVPAQWNSLERAAKGDPVVYGEAPVANPGGNNGSTQSQQQDSGLSFVDPLIRDASVKVVRREAHRLAEAVKKHGLGTDRFATWMNEFQKDQLHYVHGLLTPILSATKIHPDAIAVVTGAETALAWNDFTEVAKIESTEDAVTLANRWAEQRAPALANRILGRAKIAASLYLVA